MGRSRCYGKSRSKNYKKKKLDGPHRKRAPSPTHFKKLSEDNIVGKEIQTREEVSIIYKTRKLSVGDIVKITSNDHDFYYAQILHFFSNRNGEYFSRIHWLIPNQNISNDIKFQPNKYSCGPIHPELVNLDNLQFVMTDKEYVFQSQCLVTN